LRALSPQRFPDATTTLRHHAREVGRRDLQAHDGQRRGSKIVKLDNEGRQYCLGCLADPNRP